MRGQCSPEIASTKRGRLGIGAKKARGRERSWKSGDIDRRPRIEQKKRVRLSACVRVSVCVRVYVCGSTQIADGDSQLSGVA